MKGDCQRFRVAGQRRFGGVWDEFSRGFPMFLIPSEEREPYGLVCFHRKGREGRQGTKSANPEQEFSFSSYKAIWP
jgi:hypothetical protein